MSYTVPERARGPFADPILPVVVGEHSNLGTGPVPRSETKEVGHLYLVVRPVHHRHRPIAMKPVRRVRIEREPA